MCRVGLGEDGYLEVIHSFVCSFIHSSIHATHVYATPTKCQEGGYLEPCFAEGSPGFRMRSLH